MRIGIVHQDHCAGSVHLGVHGLNGERRVLREILALERALLVCFLRLMADQQNDLVLDVDPA
jgi:hypothetical protein